MKAVCSMEGLVLNSLGFLPSGSHIVVFYISDMMEGQTLGDF